MKLKLETIRDVSVLTASGPMDSENFAVLKAGIRKLLKDGKNRIVLELPDSGTLPPDVLRELAVLNLTAAELSGSIVLAKIAPLTRAKIESFSKPPVVRCFAEREQAFDFFLPSTQEIPAAPPPPTPAGSAPPMKEEIRAKELGDLGALRKELVELQSENKELKARLTELVLVRRDPPDLESWRQKVAQLEQELSAAIQIAQDAADKK